MKTVRFFSHCRVRPSYFDSLFFSNLQFVSRLLLPLAHVISRIEVHLSLPMKLIAALEETDYLTASALDDRLVRLYTHTGRYHDAFC